MIKRREEILTLMKKDAKEIQIQDSLRHSF